ncbi:MAG: hypothetical protein WDN09_01960 [bacterium]
MRNSKHFSIPRNIPCRAGISHMKSVALGSSGTLVLSIILLWTVSKLFWPESMSDMVIGATLFSAFLPFVMVGAYLYGRSNTLIVRRYLYALRDRCNDAMISFVLFEPTARQEIDQEMRKIKWKVKDFFQPLIINYLCINTVSKERQWDALKKAMNNFQQKTKSLDDEDLQAAASFLESYLSDITYNAIYDRKEIDFDANWFEQIDFTATRQAIRERVYDEYHARESRLFHCRDRIDALIKGRKVAP